MQKILQMAMCDEVKVPALPFCETIAIVEYILWKIKKNNFLTIFIKKNRPYNAPFKID